MAVNQSYLSQHIVTTVPDLGEELMEAILSLIVISALLSWAAEHESGGTFSVGLDILGAVASFVLAPSTLVLIAGTAFIFSLLKDGF